MLITAEIFGLPVDEKNCDGGIFAFHIHEGGECSGSGSDLFANAKGHYNPNNCPHPYHAGDLPPLIGNNGYAYMSVLSDRFTAREIIGRTVMIQSFTRTIFILSPAETRERKSPAAELLPKPKRKGIARLGNTFSFSLIF